MEDVKCTICQHDYDNAIHAGRCLYLCPICKQDITLILVMLEELKRTESDL